MQKLSRCAATIMASILNKFYLYLTNPAIICLIDISTITYKLSLAKQITPYLVNNPVVGYCSINICLMYV